MNKKVKIIVLLFVLFSNSIFAQEETNIDTLIIKCKYTLTCQPDSNNSEYRWTEKMLLLIGNEYSHFIALNLKGRERKTYEALKVSIETGTTLDMRKFPRSRFSFQIYKENQNDKITTYDRIYGDRYIYYENKNIFDWCLTEEQDFIAGYNCQKATTSFGGRDYTAWFSHDIPISEGPYKFNGLPGLIVKIHDTKNHYVFELISFEKIKTEEFIISPFASDRYLEVTNQELKKIRQNTADNLREIMSKSSFQVSEGQMELSLENAKKRNNPIELK